MGKNTPQNELRVFTECRWLMLSRVLRGLKFKRFDRLAVREVACAAEAGCYSALR
jgi:hypothetical protein